MHIVKRVFAANEIYNNLRASGLGDMSVTGSHFKKERIFFIVNTITALSFAFGLLGIALAMFFFVTSGGKPDQVKKASSALIYGLIAMAVGISAVTLAKFLSGAMFDTGSMGIGFE